jgi:hypothetical protein
MSFEWILRFEVWAVKEGSVASAVADFVGSPGAIGCGGIRFCFLSDSALIQRLQNNAFEIQRFRHGKQEGVIAGLGPFFAHSKMAMGVSGGLGKQI